MRGQWFLISAVIIVGVFLLVSTFFRDYYATDTTAVPRMDEEHYFWELKMNFNGVVRASDCDNLEDNLNEFSAFSRQKMAELGYFLYLNYTIDMTDCTATPKIVLASDRMVLNEGINATTVIPKLR
jgi:hypothetical protein